ncbi:MAG TPA: glycosyltransferase family 2 protein [Candidatus Limiplasma sp.]|nr:glycosyltransferase family 2 protein [Candidatus Limiplasma sp.]
MEVVSTVIGGLNWVMSLWLILIILYQLYISVFGFKRVTKDYQDHDPKLKYLVLVPAHNEEAVIGGIIENLQAMDYPKELYDFYILADNCEDRTADIARSMGANVLETHKESADAPTGKPIVLQKALNTLKGYGDRYDLVMFFDADNRIDTNMFREVNSQFLDHPEADIVQCYLGCKNKKGLVALYYYMSYTITNRFFQYAKSRIGINCVVGGTGFAVRADYLQKRGGWTSMSLTEDFELQVEATCEGKRILWNNNVRIYDEKPTLWRASLRQRVRWAQGHWFVCFRNTRRIFRALREKRIGFGEFLSTFLYVYSLTPFIVMIIQLALSLILQIFIWTGLMPVADTTITFWDWFTVNYPSLLIFLYSFIVLFYVADWLDNGVRFHPLSLINNIVSLGLNTVIVAGAQIWGLFRFRHQKVWVKTTHKINAPHEGCLYNPNAETGTVYSPRSDTTSQKLNPAENGYPL